MIIPVIIIIIHSSNKKKTIYIKSQMYVKERVSKSFCLQSNIDFNDLNHPILNELCFFLFTKIIKNR